MLITLRRGTVAASMLLLLTAACSTPPDAPDPIDVNGGAQRSGQSDGQAPRQEPFQFVSATHNVTVSEVSQTGIARATLAMSDVKVYERHDSRGSGSGWEWYFVPLFRITETSGASGITITSLSYAASEALPFDPVPLSFAVSAGSSSELGEWFQDNDYGAPAVLSPVPLSVITVTVTFIDDRGAGGRLSGKFTLI